MISFCKECLLPNTKPYIKFSLGICSACIFHRKKNNFKKNKAINWKKRKKEFLKLIKGIKKKILLYLTFVYL